MKKKTARKLVLRSQTIRVLTDIEVVRAVGGLNSDNVQCPAVAAIDTGRVACPTWPG